MCLGNENSLGQISFGSVNTLEQLLWGAGTPQVAEKMRDYITKAAIFLQPWSCPFGARVSIDLFSRAVASRVSLALQSLTSVFGMGTGGPSAFITLTSPVGVSPPALTHLCGSWRQGLSPLRTEHLWRGFSSPPFEMFIENQIEVFPNLKP